MRHGALKAIIIEREHRSTFVRWLWMMVIIEHIARNTVGPGGLDADGTLMVLQLSMKRKQGRNVKGRLRNIS